MTKRFVTWLALAVCASANAQDGTPDTAGFAAPLGYREFNYTLQSSERDFLGEMLARPNGTVLYGINVTNPTGSIPIPPIVVNLMAQDGSDAPGLFGQTFLGTPGMGLTLKSMATQSNGNVLVLVDDPLAPDNICYLYRLLSTGGVDSSFGSGGRLSVSVDTGLPDGLVAPVEVLVQSDNKILVAATVGPRPPPNISYSVSYAMTVTRLTANGQADTTYGNGGTSVVTRFAEIEGSSPHELLTHARFARDGGLLLAGATDYYPGTSTPSKAVVAKLNTGGQEDVTFGSGGALILGTEMPEVLDVALTRASGFYLLGGVFYGGYELLRFDASGQRDFGFGVFGTAYLEVTETNYGPPYTVPGKGFGLGVQNDGKIIVGGNADPYENATHYATAYRFLTSGFPDPDYGNVTFGSGVFSGGLVDYSAIPGGFDVGVGATVMVQNNQTLLSGRFAGIGIDTFIYRLQVDEIFPSSFEHLIY
jgi:uncharacterized delta-60 repeat protein